MRKLLTGVRVLEDAQFIYAPSAGPVLADWGADVIKIEHPVTGDAQRGLVKVLGAAAGKLGSSFALILDAPNRGKHSVGMALDSAETRPEFDELVRRSNVFLISYLPSARTKLHIDVDDVLGPRRQRRRAQPTRCRPLGVHTRGRAYGDNIGGKTIAGSVVAPSPAGTRPGSHRCSTSRCSRWARGPISSVSTWRC